MKYLFICISFLLLLCSSCWIQTTETRGTVDTKNLVTFEDVRSNPDKYLGKQISFRFKVMCASNFENLNDTDCSEITFIPERYFGTHSNRRDGFLYALNTVMKTDLKILTKDLHKYDKETREYHLRWIKDIKETDPKTVLNDFGVWNGRINCALPDELFNNGFDYLSEQRFINGTEAKGEYIPSMTNTYTGGIATGILYNVKTRQHPDTDSIRIINNFIGKKMHSTFISFYLTGVQFKKNLF